jgi:heptosyltransferase-2
LERLGIPKTEQLKPIIGIFPGASYGPAKMWGAEKFRMLAEKIVKTGKAKILVFGGNKEKELGEIIQNKTDGIINLCGKTTARELMALIKKCNVFITNDTGPMHIASALNVPVIAIFGPTNPDRTSPLGSSAIIKKEVKCAPCKYRICPLKNHKCMESISVEEVFEAAGKYIK